MSPGAFRITNTFLPRSIRWLGLSEGTLSPFAAPPPCTSIHHLSRELMLQFCANQAAVLGDGCAVCRVWLGWQGCIFSAANKPLPSMALHTTTVYTQGTLSPSAPPLSALQSATLVMCLCFNSVQVRLLFWAMAVLSAEFGWGGRGVSFLLLTNRCPQWPCTQPLCTHRGH